MIDKPDTEPEYVFVDVKGVQDENVFTVRFHDEINMMLLIIDVALDFILKSYFISNSQLLIEFFAHILIEHQTSSQ